MVAQRWDDQCQEGHDLERSKLDGSPVGQNAWQQKESMMKDEAAVQAEIAGADKSWYGEVSNPGGIQGHYTQLVWADTEEMGCGLIHYKVKQLRLHFIFMIDLLMFNQHHTIT